METNCQFNTENLEKSTQKIQNDRSNLVLLDHQLLKNNLTLSIDKINSKQTYPIIISSKVNIPTCRVCFEKRFPLYIVTIKAYLRSFQYKIINNVLYHKKKLHTLSLSNTQLCFFANGRKDNMSPISSCTQMQKSRSGLFHWLFSFFTVNTRECHFGFHNIDNDTFLIQNHIPTSLQTTYIWNTRKYGFLAFNNFPNDISKTKNLERIISINNQNKCERYWKKWHRVENKIP